MWNILIVLIIAIVVWMFGPAVNFNGQSVHKSIDSRVKQQKTAKEVTNEVQKQVDYARQLQQEEQNRLNN